MISCTLFTERRRGWVSEDILHNYGVSSLSSFRLLVKVLEKLSRSGFRFVGMKLTESENTGHSEKVSNEKFYYYYYYIVFFMLVCDSCVC